MKIKNIMFSGFAAAIFVGLCGAANAAAIELISKPYADANLQGKLKQGDNISIGADNTISATGLATTEQLATKADAFTVKADSGLVLENGVLSTSGIATSGNLKELQDTVAGHTTQIQDINTEIDTLATAQALADLETVVNAKAAQTDMTAAQTAINEAKAAIEALQSGKADALTVTTLQETVDNLGQTYATDDELTAAINGVKALIPTKVSAFENDAGYLVASDLGDYAKSADVNADLALKADTSALESAVSALETEIAKKAAQTDMTAAQTAIDEAKAAIEALQSGKADASTVTTLQETVSNLGQTYATDAELSAAVAAVEAKIPSLDEYAKSADVAATYATQAYVGVIPSTATAKDIVGYVQEKTSGIATSDNLAELTGRVATAETDIDSLEGRVSANETAIAGKADSTKVAEDIAAAVAGKANSTDVYTKTEVEGKITTATADLATKSELNAVSTVANAAAVKADVDAALENIYTKAEVDSAIDAIEEYDDTALAGRVTANEGAISTNAAAITALQNAGYVAGTKTAGSYLVNFDAAGNASYAPVAILDAQGAPIDLTSGAVK